MKTTTDQMPKEEIEGYSCEWTCNLTPDQVSDLICEIEKFRSVVGVNFVDADTLNKTSI